jgi:hypothetical protein
MVPPSSADRAKRFSGYLCNQQNHFASVWGMRFLIPAAIVALVLAAPAQAKLAPADRAAINRTLDAFVATAVRRHDVAKSYNLMTPQERGGMTRAQWAQGDIPVYPYPARGTSWHGWVLDYALENEVAFELVLEPQRGHKLDPISFSASVKRIHGRWLVDSFYPAATFMTSQHRVIGPRDFAAPSMVSAAGNSRLGAVWILVPASVGFLGLAAVIGFLVVNLLRSRTVAPSEEKQARDAEFYELLRARKAQG